MLGKKKAAKKGLLLKLKGKLVGRTASAAQPKKKLLQEAAQAEPDLEDL